MSDPDLPAVGDTTLDYFFGDRFHMYQPKHGPRVSIDGLLLAAFVSGISESACQILDAGAGTGIVSLALSVHAPMAEITAVEREPELVSLLEKNITSNGLSSRMRAVKVDLTTSHAELCAAGLMPGSYSHVVANPPFFERGTVRVPPQNEKAGAHSAEPGALAKWVHFITRMCAPKGQMTLIHRAEKLPNLLAQLTGRFGGLVIFPLYPREGQPAKRIIVTGTKGSRAQLRLDPGLVLHNRDGSFTTSVNQILRNGARMSIAPAKGRFVRSGEKPC